MAKWLMGGVGMSGKVLLNVYSIQVKNDLLSIFVDNDMDVLEVINEHDLLFKHRLIKNNLDVYVQEFDEEHYDRSIAQLEMIDRDKVRCVVMIHAYSSQIIDDTLALNVKDIIVLPMKRDDLKRKILPPVYVVSKAEAMPKEPVKLNTSEDSVQKTFREEPLVIEIARANRGNYPLSLVLVNAVDFSKEAFSLFEDELRRLLRTTDEILEYDEKTMLLMCPFTTKDHVVEVENKVREAFSAVRFRGYSNGNMYLYGVTYPTDGRFSKPLLRLLKDGIHDSRLFSELDGPLSKLTQKDVRNKLRRNFR